MLCSLESCGTAGCGGMDWCVTSLMEADPRAEETGAWIRFFSPTRFFWNGSGWRHASHLLAAAGLNLEITSVLLSTMGFIQVEFKELEGFYSVVFLSYHQTKFFSTVFKFIIPYYYLKKKEILEVQTRFHLLLSSLVSWLMSQAPRCSHNKST